jgi:nitrogen fixation/metabolism regulation signal transduction histidine kinase
VTLNLGEAWFSSRVQTALDNAVGVARQYMIEQGRHILYDAGEIEAGSSTIAPCSMKTRGAIR